MSFFTGWIGYGTGVVAGVLQEPADPSYARRMIVFSGLENGVTFDVTAGTVGPSTTAWGTIAVAGLFDAASGGNLLVSFALPVPVAVGVGSTLSTSSRANVITGCPGGPGTLALSLPSGSTVGLSPDGRLYTANVALQILSGVLSAQAASFGGSVTMGVLPSQSPSSGTGQLWNNGGIVSVA